MSDPSLDLQAVRNRFAEAAERLEKITESATRLESESAQLSDAKNAVREFSQKVAELVSMLKGLTRQLIDLAGVLEKTDPATMVQGLEEVRRTTTSLGEEIRQDRTSLREELRGIKGRVGDLEAATEETKQAVEQNTETLTANLTDLKNTIQQNTERLTATVTETKVGVEQLDQDLKDLANLKVLISIAIGSSVLAAILAALSLVR